MRKLAIIPARSGSKGLVDKNIKKMGDKPLLAHTIEAAHHSEIFDAVVVSTDSVEYADIAEQYGAEVPFLRSESLSSDEASTWDVVKEVINWYEKNGSTFDVVCLLQPTSPLRTGKHIQEAYHLYNSKGASSVVSVCEVEHSPLWSNTLKENLSMNNFISRDVYQNNRQMLEKYYRINGAIYLVDTDYLFRNGNLYGENSFAYKMSKQDSIDIDDAFDFMLAEVCYNHSMSSKKNL